MWTHWLIVIVYFIALAGLAVWGVHRLVLLYWLKSEPKKPWTDASFHPQVLIQLPVFNEPSVVARVIDATARMEWKRLVIQVLDDSKDETSAIAKSRIEYWRDRGLNITHVQRTDRTGFKAGALAHGLNLDHSEFVAIFDADFIPEPNFLQQLMPLFSDPKVGMVQARWDHINRNQNLLTRLVALLLDGHFLIEHTARYRRNCFFNFNGTAGVWRRDCIQSSGGWAHDTITEDLDLSYRAQLGGWQFIYRDDLAAPGEVPSTMRAFLTQQHRWAKGTVQTARKLASRIVRSNFPFVVKLEALNHLCMVAAYPAIFLLALLLPSSITARQVTIPLDLSLIDLGTILATTGSLFIFYAKALSRGGLSVLRRWWEIPMAMGLGVGTSVSQTLAVLEGLFSNDATFNRTPKQGAMNKARIVPKALPLQLMITSTMAVYYLHAIQTEVQTGHWASIPLLSLFGLGFAAVSLAQFAEGGRTVEAVEMDVAPATK